MGILVKVLIGTAVAGGAGAAIAVAVDHHQQKKAEQKVREAKTEIERAQAVMARNEREEKSVIQRIKKYVEKKVVKFLSIVALHMEQIEAAAAVIGLASAAIGIASAVKDYKNGNDTQEKLDWIIQRIQEDERAVNHNNVVFASAEELVLDRLGVDQETLNEHIESNFKIAS